MNRSGDDPPKTDATQPLHTRSGAGGAAGGGTADAGRAAPGPALPRAGNALVERSGNQPHGGDPSGAPRGDEGAARAPRRIRPRQMQGRRGFRADLQHPARGRICVGLGTSDPREAERICGDLSAFANHPREFPDAARAAAAGYHPTAVRIWFGVCPPARAPTPWELLVEAWCDESAEARRFFRKHVPALESELATLRPRVEDLEAENSRLRRATNKHVRTALARAIEEWAAEYPTGHAQKTVHDAVGAVRAFGAWVARQPRSGRGQPLLGEVRAAQVTGWLASLRRQPRLVRALAAPVTRAAAGVTRGAGGAAQTSAPAAALAELSPITRRKLRAYLGGFWSWAVRRYDLAEHPVAKSAPIAGVARRAERIVAFRRPEELTDLFEALRPWPYWRAFVALGCLAGLRWGEQCRLRLGDVSLADNSLRVLASKTGRLRTVPLERTIALPLLREHLGRRAAERAGRAPEELPLLGEDGPSPGLAAALLTDLVFPCVLAAGTRPRTRTAPGEWSSSSNFLKAWRRVREAAWRRRIELGLAAVDSRPPECWAYGPREWRHTAGAAMGHSGMSSLQISQWLGNSESIARRHYIPPTGAERWPFRW